LDEIAFCLTEAAKRLDAAKLLLREGYYHDAVSRAYYAMYYASKALLLREGLQAKTHEGLVSKMGELMLRGIIEPEYAKMLGKAKDMRGTADYGMYKDFSSHEVRALIEEAEQFLKRVRRAIEGGRKESSGR
jgi:uncharacterized protein (UPF0332 family)